MNTHSDIIIAKMNPYVSDFSESDLVSRLIGCEALSNILKNSFRVIPYSCLGRAESCLGIFLSLNSFLVFSFAFINPSC